MSLLGIDIGTTGCKTAAYSESGRCLASSYREYITLHPAEGQLELDSRDVVSRVMEAIREVATQTVKDPVTALCISSMGEAMTPVSADRQILGNSIIASQDTRGADHLDEVVRRIGQETFYNINPNILTSNYSLPKLLWIRHHQPDLYAKAYKFLLWGDLITFMLGCEPYTSYSLANRTLLFDIHSEDWSSELLEISGIDQKKLPVTVSSGTVAGTIPDTIASELTLPKGTSVVIGGHDQCCNALGAGIYTAGKAVCGIGTFECITPVYDHIPKTSGMLKEGLNVEHHVLPGLYVSFIYNHAGSLVRWFRDTFAVADKKLSGRNLNIYDVLAQEMPQEPTRLLTLPYFEPGGAPHFASDVPGIIAGLKLSTTRGEILKSIMEGVTFYFVESLDILRTMNIGTSEFVATGGGAKSDAWLQIKADILGVPFVRPRITECGTLGAAILAGIATNVFRNAREGVSLFVKRDRLFEPDPQRHRIYSDRYVKYKELYSSTRGLMTQPDS